MAPLSEIRIKVVANDLSEAEVEALSDSLFEVHCKIESFAQQLFDELKRSDLRLEVDY